MKKRNLILQAAVAATLAGSFSAAMATGAITAPAAAVKFAVESMTSTTDITLPNIVYTIGVERTSAQDFTINYTLPAGYAFNASPAVPTMATAMGVCTLKRGGVAVSEVVYDCDITTGPLVTGSVITLVAPQIRDVGTAALLGTAGNTLSMQVKLTEAGETACVDNIGTPSTCFVSASVGAAINGVDFSTDGTVLGLTADTGNTVIDVAATVPLAGFVTNATAPADTVTVAAASVLLRDNLNATAWEPDGTTDYSMKVGDKYTYTVTDPTGFLGIAAGKLCLDANANSILCEAGEAFTVTGNTGTLTVTLAAAGAPNSARNISYQSDAVTAMGTGRTLGIAGSVDVPGVDHALTGNASWWVWSSNGTQLQTTYFSNAPGYTTRFVLTNTGTSPASYSTACLAETGNTATLGAKATGSGASGIPAGGQLVLTSTDVCAFSGATRGATVFTVNAPTGNVQGSYQVTSPNGGVAIAQMVRPGTN